MWDVETTDVFDRWFDEQTEALKEDMIKFADAEYRKHLNK